MKYSFRYLVRLAWQDSRRNRGRLFLFMSAIVLGIAALVAINSFNDNLARDIDLEAASLLGADLAITGNRPMSDSTRQLLDTLPATDQAAQIDLLSMAFLPSAQTSQFVRIIGLEGEFPFYGTLETVPGEAAHTYREGPYALIDASMMRQHDLKPGDRLRLGEWHAVIAGSISSAFGSADISSSFAPVVYIPLKYMDSTGLIQPGSLINYAYYYQLDRSFDVDAWKLRWEDEIRKESMRLETVADRKENVAEAFDNLNYFLNLVGLVALLLGCIGVASSVWIYVRSKMKSIAVLRCLGMRAREAFLVYFLQIGGLGMVSVLIGAGLGMTIQLLLPALLQDFLPFTVQVTISWPAIVEGILVGAVVTMLFALLPLITISKISPMMTLRQTEVQTPFWKDRWQLTLGLTILLTLFLFLWKLTGEWQTAMFFVLGLGVAFAVLFLMSLMIMWLVRRYFPRQWSFVFRQGLANLFRPHNQTQILVVSIGLGTAVLTTLFIVQGLLLRNVASMDANDQPNMFLFGIETSQKDTLAAMAEARGMPLLQQMPIVTMRLVGWQGKSKEAWLEDTTRTARNWAVHRETRATYRDWLDSNEEVITGDFPRPHLPGDSIFISLAKPFYEAMDLSLGDELVFNVQGALMKTYVGSVREIDNANMRARFLVLFPSGVLEQAPQFHVLVTRSPDVQMTAAFRNEVVAGFPNVSVVDLTMILESLQKILDKVRYVIQFMAIFSILTGLIVLINSLLLSKYQRIKESVLLRTLGAVKRQIRWINATEYLLLGALSTFTGALLSLVAGYLLARFQLELEFVVPWYQIVLVCLAVAGITLIIGLANSREVVQKSPLEVLRKEVG